MSAPLFTVVVPTRDRPARLRACLAALEVQTLPRDRFEVVVVDDGSDPPVEPLTGPGRRLLRSSGEGPAAARNAGAADAAGAWLAFVDDDCRAQPGWLAALAARAADHPGAAIGGHTRNALEANPWSAASQLLIDFLYDWYGTRGGAARFFTTSNLAVPTAAFRRLGGFDPAFRAAGAEDRDFCERWAAAGLPLVHAPEAVVNHEHALGPRGFWRQHATYGRGAWRLHRQRSERGASNRLEPARFYAAMLRAPFAARARRPWRIAALLVAAQAANAAGFAAASLDARRRPRNGRGGREA